MDNIKLFEKDSKVDIGSVQEKSMTWSYKRSFYGNKKILNTEKINTLLSDSYLKGLFTIYDDWFKRTSLVRYDIKKFSNVKKPFPDLLLSQKPVSKFALHLSGGIDSCLLALLYDSEQADYFTVTVKGSSDEEFVSANEFVKSSKLKGKHHHIILSPEEGFEIAQKILPILKEPHMDPAIVLSYAASKKAKEMGHNLIIAGDGADGVFGLSSRGEGSMQTMSMWKTIEPAEMLGLHTLLPYLAPDLVSWCENNISAAQRQDKAILKIFAESVGLPHTILNKKKVGWLGHDAWCVGNVYKLMKQEVDHSPFSNIMNRGPGNKIGIEMFMEYSLIKWLDYNCRDNIIITKGDVEYRLSEIPARVKEKIKPWTLSWILNKCFLCFKDRRLPNVICIINNCFRRNV